MSDELKALDDAHRILVSKSQDLSIPIARLPGHGECGCVFEDDVFGIKSLELGECMKLTKKHIENAGPHSPQEELKRLEEEADRYALEMMEAVAKTEYAEQNLQASLSVADSARDDLHRANSRFCIAKAAHLKAKLGVA